MSPPDEAPDDVIGHEDDQGDPGDVPEEDEAEDDEDWVLPEGADDEGADGHHGD